MRCAAALLEPDEPEHLVEVARGGVVAGVEAQALADGEVELRRGLLQDDAEAVAPAAAGVARVGAEHLDVAGGGVAEALEHLDGGRLAGAVRAEQGEDLAARHVEVDAADGLDGAVGDAQAAHGDGRGGAGRARPRPGGERSR